MKKNGNILICFCILFNCSSDKKGNPKENSAVIKETTNITYDNDSLKKRPQPIFDSTVYTTLDDIKDTIGTKNKIGPIDFTMPVSLIQYKMSNCNDTLLDADSWGDGYYIREPSGEKVLSFHWNFPNKNDLKYVVLNSDRFVLKNGLKVGMSITEVESLIGKFKLMKDDDGEGNIIEDIIIDDPDYSKIFITIKPDSGDFIGTYLRAPNEIPETTAVYSLNGIIEEIVVYK